MCPNVYDELKAMMKREPFEEVATDKVCKQMIRHWCEAMEDANPMYTDEEYAGKSKYGSITAPPAMAPAWIMPPLWPRKDEWMVGVYKSVVDTCAMGGFDQIVETDNDMEFFRSLLPGDREHATARVYDFTPEKKTALGNGHFVTIEFNYTNQKGELICTQRVTSFVYKPGGNDEV